MRAFIQPGMSVKLTAPAGGVVTGTAYRIGQFFGVSNTTAAAGEPFILQLEGVFDLPKTSAQAWAEGDQLYWDEANDRLDNTAVGMLVGVATEARDNPSATGYVRMNAIGLTGGAGMITSDSAAPVSKNTAGAVTLTAAELLSGILVVDPNGAGRTYTLPTAAQLVAAIPNAKVGDLIRLYIVNGADAAETITVAAGTGGGFDANQQASSRVIVQNDSKCLHVRITDVTASSEAYVAYL